MNRLLTAVCGALLATATALPQQPPQTNSAGSAAPQQDSASARAAKHRTLRERRRFARTPHPATAQTSGAVVPHQPAQNRGSQAGATTVPQSDPDDRAVGAGALPATPEDAITPPVPGDIGNNPAASKRKPPKQADQPDTAKPELQPDPQLPDTALPPRPRRHKMVSPFARPDKTYEALLDYFDDLE